MNILFFVYGYGHASGGHYHSLNQVSREVGNGNNVKIITIGPKESPVYSSNKHFLKHIFLHNRIGSLWFLNKELNKIIAAFKPDLLHCFDTDSLNRLLVLPSTFKYPIVLNKCGGPNPKRSDYYHANGLVLFSKEDADWFTNNSNYKNELIYNIPNRVRKLEFLPVEKRLEQKDPNKITFLRVSRIGGAYEKTLKDSYRMIEELMVHFPVQLIVVGKIQDEARYQWFKKEAETRKLPIQFITDKRVSKGANFLYLADFVIGTGRSFMEAISLEIPTLTPAKNLNWPALVNERNFSTFFATNFSERNSADHETAKSNKEEIIKLITDKKAYTLTQKAVKTLFQDHLSTKMILSKYTVVYRDVLSKSSSRISLIIKNLPYLLKFYLNQ